MRHVIVHIDRLVLGGFRDHDRLAIAQGVEAELSRIFAEADAVRRVTAMGDVPRLDAGTVRIAAGSHATRTGAGIAQAIGRSIEPQP